MNEAELEQSYDALCLHAEEILVELARKTMRRCSTLHEFVIGMGEWFFVDKNGNYISLEEYRSSSVSDYWNLRPDKRVTEVADFIGKWDSVFHLTGASMKFTKNGPITRDW